jgi:ubiquinone/menaquinone biosynthesis C-methylase UbiE
MCHQACGKYLPASKELPIFKPIRWDIRLERLKQTPLEDGRLMNEAHRHTTLNQTKFDKWSATYDEKRFDFFRRLQKGLLSMLELRPNSTFLDVGCGTGWAVRQVAVTTKAKAYGIDLSQMMIERAKAAAEGIENATFQQGTAEALPFIDRFFDSIICTMSFHHYLDPSRAVGEMARTLKPKGTLHIMDVTADSFAVRWWDRKFMQKQPDHVKLYSSSEFRELYRTAGLVYLGTKRSAYPLIPVRIHSAERQE